MKLDGEDTLANFAIRGEGGGGGGGGRLVSKDLYEETPDRGPNPYPFISIFYTSFCLLLYRLYLFDKV